MTFLIRAILSFAVVSGFLLAVAVLFYRGIPTENEQLLSYMLGQLSGFVGALVAFYFGSSHGSEAKTALMADSASGRPNDPLHVEVEQ